MNRKEAEECTKLSDEEKITFPEVISRLAKAKIELYHTDLLSSNKTYYSGNTAYTVKCSSKAKEVGPTFDRDAIGKAIQEAQTGQIQYNECMRKLMAAGVFSYTVFISGRKVVYFGKRGEEHIELFPSNP